jgi:hypothetical protein
MPSWLQRFLVCHYQKAGCLQYLSAKSDYLYNAETERPTLADRTRRDFSVFRSKHFLMIQNFQNFIVARHLNSLGLGHLWIVMS